MASFSIWHWAILLIFLGVVVFPAWKIVGKTGHPPFLALLLFVPVANLAVLWFLALSKWPSVQRP